MIILRCIGGALLGAFWGIIASLVGALALFVIVGLATWNSAKGDFAANFAFLAFPIGILVGFAAPIYDRSQDRKEARERHRAKQEEHLKGMVDAGEEALHLFESLPQLLGVAEQHLDEASDNFTDRAFAPFWDSIEKAATLLGRFDEAVSGIRNHANRYTALVPQYEGKPPSFPLASGSIAKLPACTQTATRMKSIVRAAQRDFQFATIYEQRKTNQILVAGFEDLADALANMTDQISTSISSLVDSVDEMMSTVDGSLRAIHGELGELSEATNRHHDWVESQSSQRDERERKTLAMLDNIQRGRKPPF